MYITYILHIYKNTNTYIIYIYDLNFTFLLTLFSIFNVIYSADTSSSTHSIYVTHEHLSTFTCLILLLLTNILCFPSTCKKN